ncbi:MAG TPA: diguanylate cyclase [Burkholderiaceae bacterium]|nr:diguanylate cyclase [Burkholderiaceae bacterium]
MFVLGFSHYNLCAPRDVLEQLRAFYCDVIGLKVGPRPSFDRPVYWLYIGEHDVLHLIEARIDDVRSLNVNTTFDHVAFNCVNRAAVERMLIDRGIAYRVAHVPGRSQIQLFLRDPAGNGVELSFTQSDAKNFLSN